MLLGFVVGPLEFLIFVVILVLLFGGKRLVSAGRGLGTGMREFKDSIKGDEPEPEPEPESESAPRELPAGRTGPVERDAL